MYTNCTIVSSDELVKVVEEQHEKDLVRYWKGKWTCCKS